MFEGRGATEVTIFNPALTYSELLTLTTNFNTYRLRTGTVIITCGDQLNGVDISLKEMLEATMKQCSMAPAFKTKLGAEGTATISLSSRKQNLFKVALNAKEFVGIGANTGKTSYSVGDNSGTRTGSTARPFKTIIFRPYEEGKPSTDIDDWIIFPAADLEGDATIAFKIGEDRSYTITATAYDPNQNNYRVIIGDPSTVLSGSVIDYDPLAPNPNDIGYDIVLLIGQSNMVGHTPNESYDPLLDTTDPRIQQRPPVGVFANTIILADDPLWHHDQQPQGTIGLGMSFARAYLQTIPVTRKILLLPQAQGGTGFADNRWNPGNDLYNSAVNNTNAALALDPKNRLVAILWHQGENDTGVLTKAQYISRLDAMINGMRSSITGATNTRFILGEMVRDWVGTDAGRLAIQQATQETLTRLYYTAVTSSLGLVGSGGDNIHFSGASCRTLGQRYFNNLSVAAANVPSGSGGGGSTPTPPADLAIAPRWNYKFQGNFNDSSANNIVPVITNVTITTDSTRGQVANFPGGNCEILVNSGIAAAYTKAVWVKTIDDSTANQNILTGKDSPDHLLWMPVATEITFGQNGDFTTLIVPADNRLVVNTWTHVAVTFSGTTARIFVNGVQVAEKTDCTTFTGAASPAPMKIGQYDQGEGWIGQMDDVRLYDVALTPAQVLQIYKSTTLFNP